MDRRQFIKMIGVLAASGPVAHHALTNIQPVKAALPAATVKDIPDEAAQANVFLDGFAIPGGVVQNISISQPYWEPPMLLGRDPVTFERVWTESFGYGELERNGEILAPLDITDSIMDLARSRKMLEITIIMDDLKASIHGVSIYSMRTMATLSTGMQSSEFEKDMIAMAPMSFEFDDYTVEEIKQKKTFMWTG